MRRLDQDRERLEQGGGVWRGGRSTMMTSAFLKREKRGARWFDYCTW